MNSKMIVLAGVAVFWQAGQVSCVNAEDPSPVNVFFDGLMKSAGSSKQDNEKKRSEREFRDEDSRRDDHKQSVGDRWRSQREGSGPEVIVRRAYEDILNREPDQEGMRVYRSRILDDNWSEQDVRNDLRRSQERAGRNAESVDRIIRRDYQDVLGRDADPEGLATYRSKMLYDGWSEKDVRAELKKSQERHEKAEISMDQARQMVQRAYRSVLGREADAGSSVYIEKILRSHWSEDDVAKELRNSPEYKKKHNK